MPCCGGRRATAAAQWPTMTPAAPGLPPQSARLVEFIYTGRTALTAQGPITRQRYRFSGTGARLMVDSRDAPSLDGVPNLRRSGVR